MYVATVIALMGVLPVVSIIVDGLFFAGWSDLVFLIGKWFVFWAGGVMLLLAGLRQVLSPEFSARTIFATNDPGALKIVAELGFGTASIGLLGVLSLLRPEWVLPAAIVSGLFYGLAGAKHVANRERNAAEDVALVSDLAIFAVLAIFVVLKAV
jgi:hypothetical protein